jgi:hypothetical protein
VSTYPVGTVAWAEFNDGSGGEFALMTEKGWEATRGTIRRADEGLFTFRVMAVVDPVGPDPDRLYDLYVANTLVVDSSSNRIGMREAVRQFTVPVAPKPPKPDEPRRLGATVRDSSDRVWVKVGRPALLGSDKVWAREDAIDNGQPLVLVAYSDIDVVEVVVESG